MIEQIATMRPSVAQRHMVIAVLLNSAAGIIASSTEVGRFFGWPIGYMFGAYLGFAIHAMLSAENEVRS